MKRFTQEIAKTTRGILDVAARVADHDPSRPEYHFHAPAQWMDDPNGIIYHKGYYHMMYSLNPDSSTARAGMVYKTGSNKWDPSDPDWTGGITVWGHARSRDLVHWEHLPVALYPDQSRDEYYIWFGCTAINDEQVPVAIYTSIGNVRNPTDSAEQWIAFGDDDLIQWESSGDINPIITEQVHGDRKIWEWRDPFLLRHDGRAYLILGGKQDEADGGRAVVLLYEALDTRFTEWRYKGILFEYPDPRLRSVECPNLIRLGDQWVLLLSSHGKAEYFVGMADLEACRFVVERRGMCDHSVSFYATNVLTDGRGRQLMWGAVEGFRGTSGWNGINSLPRELGLDGQLRLVQRVPEELQTLRETRYAYSGKMRLKVDKATLEIIAHVPAGESYSLQLLNETDEAYRFILADGVAKAGPYEVQLDADPVDLRFFVDKSVVEVFINDRECVTLTIPACTGCAELAVDACGADTTVWRLHTDNLFTVMPYMD